MIKSYSSMSQSYKESSFSTSYLCREDSCAAYGNERGGGGPRITHFSPPILYFWQIKEWWGFSKISATAHSTPHDVI